MFLQRRYANGQQACSLSLVTREMQIKTWVRYLLTPIRMTTIKKQNRNSLMAQQVKDLALSLLWLWLQQCMGSVPGLGTLSCRMCGQTKQNKQTEKRKYIGEDVEELESLCTFDRNIKWCSCYRKEYGSSSNIKNRITIWSSKITTEYVSKRFENKIFFKKISSLK